MNTTIDGNDELEERSGNCSGSSGIDIDGGARGVRKGSWTEEEDILLRLCVEKYGEGNWRQIPRRAGLNRCRKSCRLRWLNYLRPNINRSRFAHDEVDLILRLHKLLGNKWSLIARRLPGRTANDVKNYWNTHLRRPSSYTTCPQNPAPQNTEALTAAPTTTLSSAKPAPQKISHEVIKPQPRTLKKSWTWSARRLPSSSSSSMLVEHGDDKVQHSKEEAAHHQHEPRRETEDWWKNFLMQDDDDMDAFFHNWGNTQASDLPSSSSDQFVPDALAPPADTDAAGKHTAVGSTLTMEGIDAFCMVPDDFSLDNDFWNGVIN